MKIKQYGGEFGRANSADPIQGCSADHLIRRDPTAQRVRQRKKPNLNQIEENSTRRRQRQRGKPLISLVPV
ncbi:hypothetical protein F2P81_000147 [Scophthalmus maximus]|uniref:Uncharacterized protein n=1 Tax=Scophthalmus maximus TaxID=52904 RepID=A0A6A4TTF4_SCOMX|nr:hypothetical protein F2P81_000147 [Scophthalmus maximus]